MALAKKIDGSHRRKVSTSQAGGGSTINLAIVTKSDSVATSGLFKATGARFLMRALRLRTSFGEPSERSFDASVFC